LLPICRSRQLGFGIKIWPRTFCSLQRLQHVHGRALFPPPKKQESEGEGNQHGNDDADGDACLGSGRKSVAIMLQLRC
jgi:hypothetical protein